MATAITVNGTHSPPKDETSHEHSPSRFTAVNGRDANSTVVNGNGTTANGNALQNAPNERRDTFENPKTVTDVNSVSNHHDERSRENVNGSSPQHLEQNSHRGSSPHPSRMSSPHKRKRSDSEEGQISPPRAYHRHSLPKSPSSRTPDNVDPRIQSTSPDGPGHPPRSGHSNYPRLDDENEDRGSSTGTWNEYDSHGPHHVSNSHSLDASDAHLAEALQRNNQEQDAGQNGWATMRHGDETGQESQHYTSYTSDQRSSQTAQASMKRKRVFSNRTKTGCMTCRRRKKKCDEGQPHCMYSVHLPALFGDLPNWVDQGNNCIRGGFVCEGYSSRNTWQKPSNAKGPIPLQSKDGYPEIPGQHLTTQEMSPAAHNRHPMHHSDGSNIQPIVVDDRDQMRQSYITSPTAPGPGPHSQGPWS
jgi:hypothetical protein